MDKRKYEENNNKKSKKILKFVNNNVSKDIQNLIKWNEIYNTLKKEIDKTNEKFENFQKQVNIKFSISVIYFFF